MEKKKNSGVDLTHYTKEQIFNTRFLIIRER